MVTSEAKERVSQISRFWQPLTAKEVFTGPPAIIPTKDVSKAPFAMNDFEDNIISSLKS